MKNTLNTDQAPSQDPFILPAEPNPLAFIMIKADKTVTIVSKHLAMGQGIYTGLDTLVADELDAASDLIGVVAAPGQPTPQGPCGNALFGAYTIEEPWMLSCWQERKISKPITDGLSQR